jgi:hypothetical protein
MLRGLWNYAPLFNEFDSISVNLDESEDMWLIKILTLKPTTRTTCIGICKKWNRTHYAFT